MRIKTKISLPWFFIVVLAIGTLGFWSASLVQRNLDEESQAFLNTILSSYVTEVLQQRQDILETNNLQGVPSYVEQYQQSAIQAAREINFYWPGWVMAYDRRGHLIFTTGGHDVGDLQRFWQQNQAGLLGLADREVAQGFFAGEQFFLSTYYQPWGWYLTAVVDQAALHQSVQDVRMATLFWIAGVIVVSIVFLAWVTHFVLISPINSLRRATAEISSGNYVDRVNVRSGDDLGDLARDIETMSTRIREKERQLQEVNDQLELRVQERTKQLSDRNKELDHSQVKLRTTIKELENERDLSQRYLDIAGVMLVSLDTNGAITLINKKGCDLLGYREADLLGANWFETCLPPVGREKVKQVFKQLMRGDVCAVEYYENDVLKENGEIRTLAFHHTLTRDSAGNVSGTFSSGEDITERKAYENKLRWTQRRDQLLSDTAARLLQSNSPQALIEELCHRVMEFIDCQAFFNFLEDDQKGKLHLNAYAGLPEQEANKIEWLEHGVAVCGCVAQTCRPMVCEDILDRDDALTDLVKSYGIQAYCCHPLMVGDRLIGTLSFGRRSAPCFEQEEIDLMASVANLVAVAMNRIKTEHRLRESELRFRAFAELAPVGIVISDEKENTLYANPRFTELFGYTVEDMPSVEQWRENAYPDEAFRDQIRQQWQVAIAEAERIGSKIKPLEHPVTCKDGTIRHTEFRMATTGDLNVVVFTDISERKKAEVEQDKLQAQLLQAQKMESVGRLAGGVAHDFNNMLGVILGNTELALDRVGPEGEMQELLYEIQQAARRSAEITRQLLAFARRQTINPQVLDLNETVESMLKMLRRLIGENINLLWKPGPGVWSVKIDPSQLDQILANLCVNARDAIADVGRITIETDNVRFDEEYCADHPGFVVGEYVLLAVSDDGCGMDKKTQEKIFEPFYTTKDADKGTGLGLATIYGIVKQNEGFINVYSEQERGTTFRIYFARHSELVVKAEKHVTAEILRGSGETVLILEDEAAILKMTRRILENFGYTVLQAANPTEAIAQVRNLSGEVDLLITDVVMPEMNGRDLAKKLQVDYPRLKVLFMSGYTANVIAHHGVLDSGVQFIQKPFAGRDLALKIREVIGK